MLRVERRNDLMEIMRRFKEWSITNIRWFTRAAIALLAAFLVIHQFYPPLAEAIGKFLGFHEPSLLAVIAFILVVFILERTFVLEEVIRRPALQISDRVRGEIKQPTVDQEVGDTFVASGSAKGVQQGLHLWLAIEINGRIWPNEGELLLEDDGSWKTTVFEEGTAARFSLSLFAANEEGHDYIRSWLRSSVQTGSYPELRRTIGMRRLARVTGLRRQKQPTTAPMVEVGAAE
jgi:hypothetical protein